MSIHWGGRGAGHVNRLPRAIGALSPFSGATMLLDFTNPVLDPRITFSRGTNATLVDSTGKITYAPANLLLQSQTFDVSPWSNTTGGTGIAATVSANAGEAPDGTTTADRLQFSLGGGTTTSDITRRKQDFATPAYTHIYSVYLRSTDGVSTYNMHIVGSNGSTTNIVVTGSWQRFSVSGVGTGASVQYAVGLRGGQTPANSNTADVLAWGAQLEAVTYQTTPGPYVATTASAYYGPRFDYDPVTLAPRGLLIEEARTNLALRSAEFDNASWAKGNATISANSTTAPDGTTSADTLVSAASTAATFAQQTVTPTAAAHTFTVYVKASGARFVQLLWASSISTDFANFDLTLATVTAGTYTSASITNAANGWYRLSITSTLAAAAGAVNIYLVDSGAAARGASFTGNGTSGVFLWGAQLEAGAFATSYIPTVASTVSRSADVATMTGTNFSTWYNQTEGTFVAEASTLKPTTLAAPAEIVSANDGTSSNRAVTRFLTANAEGLNVTGGTAVAQITQAYVANSVEKLAFAIKANDFAFARNGSLAGSDTSGAMPVSVDRLSVGGPGPLNGHIRAIAYYNTRLPNTQLQTLTAPSLASPLALDFISPTYTVGY